MKPYVCFLHGLVYAAKKMDQVSRDAPSKLLPAPDTINFPDQGGCNDLGFPPSAPAVENESYDGAVTAEVIEAEYTLWLGRARAVDVSIGPR